MRNQASPSLVISPAPDVEPSEEELDRTAKKFNEKYAGSEGSGKAMFLSGASTVTQIGAAPKDMGYEAGFTQMRDAVLGIHGVPPIAAGISGGGSYAAYYAELKQFTHLTMQPIFELLAEEDTERLAPQFGAGLTIEYEASAIDDPDVLEKRLATDIAARAITKRELRALRGLPPFGDERDDQFAGVTPDAPSQHEPPPDPVQPRSDDRWHTTGQSGPPRPENGHAPKWHNRLVSAALESTSESSFREEIENGNDNRSER